MLLSTPPVARLRAFGLTQTAMAAHLGVTQAAVSLWLAGKRPFEEPWRTDAEALLAIVSEHLAQGKPLATVAFRPSHFMNRGGTHAPAPGRRSRSNSSTTAEIAPGASGSAPRPLRGSTQCRGSQAYGDLRG